VKSRTLTASDGRGSLYLDGSPRLEKEPRLSGVRMSLLLTDGDEKPAAGEFFANIGRRQGGFLRGAVQADFSHGPPSRPQPV